MKVGIIGAGFTGLAVAYELSRQNHKVHVFEKEGSSGGLAIGFKKNNWKWVLEKHYHHLFTSDWAIRKLAGEVGHKVIFKRPKTSVFIDGKGYQLDSPLSLLSFKKLSIIDRMRVGIFTLFLKTNPFWKPLESITTESFLKKTMGEKSWKVLWKPLLEKKFGKFANRVPASWFWARIKKRSPSLGYPEGGFGSLAKRIQNYSEKKGATFIFNTSVSQIRVSGKGFEIRTSDDKRYIFDKVVCTLPMSIFLKITVGFPKAYKAKMISLEGLGALNMILTLSHKFLTDGTYWLNINESKFPFLAVIEQTNFINRKFYGGRNLVYVGNYLPKMHRYFEKSDRELFEEFYPFLKKINPRFDRNWVKEISVFKTPFAQPIIPLNYSKKVPPTETFLKGLYLANIQQVYPWDRGTNYAVELGLNVARKIMYTSKGK